MHAYTNPAFHPAFVSRIPKPGPHRPPQPKDPLSDTPLGDAPQQLLEELPSTSHMQPAPQPHVLPAGLESPGLLQPAQHAQHSGVQLDSVTPSSATRQQQQDDSSVQQDDSLAQLFLRPGHEVVSVVWQEESPVATQPHERQAAAMTAGHALRAELDGIQQGSSAEEEEQRGFADGCRRLVAVIEVGQPKSLQYPGQLIRVVRI